MFFHGCSVLEEKPGLKILLTELGPEARVYVHSTLGEAGRAHQFYEVTLPAGKSAIESKRIPVTTIIPEGYIRKWAKKKRLGQLFKLIRATGERRFLDDVKKIVIEAFKILKEIMPYFSQNETPMEEIQQFLPNLKKIYQKKIVGNIINRDITIQAKVLIFNENLTLINRNNKLKKIFY